MNRNSRIVLFDADGLIVKSKGKKFSERLSELYGISLGALNVFFENEFKSCLIGKADLRQELPRHLVLWGWEGTLDDLLTLWFSWEEELDERVIATMQRLRAADIRCYLVSDQEHYRARYFWETMNLKTHCDGAFFSCDLGHKKSERVFYEEALKHLGGTAPKEALFFDDDEKNVKAAQEFGVQAYLYKNFGDFEQKIQELCEI